MSENLLLITDYWGAWTSLFVTENGDTGCSHARVTRFLGKYLSCLGDDASQRRVCTHKRVTSTTQGSVVPQTFPYYFHRAPYYFCRNTRAKIQKSLLLSPKTQGIFAQNTRDFCKNTREKCVTS